MTHRFATAIAIVVLAAACSGDEGVDPTSATSTLQPTSTVTLIGLPVTVAPEAVACERDLPIEEWEIEAAVPLPGFVLPDGTEQPPAIYRLLFQRGREDGYDSVPAAAEAATSWLPAEFQPDIRSIILNHLGRDYVFEGAVVEAGGVPGALEEPCLLLASVAQIVVWYSIQVLDPLGSPQVYWVWQSQGRPIAIEPFVE